MIPTFPARVFRAACFALALITMPLAQGALSPEPQSAATYNPPPTLRAKALAYNHAHYRHYFVNAFYGLLVLIVVLELRFARKCRDLAARIARRRSLQVLLVGSALLLTVAALTLPSDLWDHSLNLHYGLSIQNWGSWFSDWITQQTLVLFLGTSLIVILYALMRWSPCRWWVFFWIACIPIVLAIFLLQPRVTELSYKLTPLQASHPELVAEIERVVQHGGAKIPPERIFEIHIAAKQTDTMAYVSGLGPSEHAAISDTTIAQLTTPEALFVFGHEMGHYVLNHIPKEIAIDLSILLVLIYGGFRLAHALLARWGVRWGISSLDDISSLPLILLVISVLAFLATPLFNSVSRHFEHEADRYGLEVIHGIVADPQNTAASAFEKTGEANLADPDPSALVRPWFFDHPTRPERIRFVSTYDPWSENQKPRYVP